MWQLEYGREARSFVLNSYPYNEAVLIALGGLMLTASGIADEGCFEIESDLYLWGIAGHVVIYKRVPAQQRLQVLIISAKQL